MTKQVEQPAPTTADFPGFFPTVMWVGVGVFLFWTTPGATFLSWQALVYFLPAMIGAGIFFGILGFTLRRVIPGLDPKTWPPGGPTPTMQFVGTLIGAGQIVLVYFLAKSVITQMLFPASA